MSDSHPFSVNKSVSIYNETGSSHIVLVCEHASNYVADCYGNLGLDQQFLNSHIAWDIGALNFSKQVAELLDAKLVFSTVSRLLYDCNRSPDAQDAIPVSSENISIPGNLGLTDIEKQQRFKLFYAPFKRALCETLDSLGEDAIVVTLHSFTPTYNGVDRDLDIGIIHDKDERLAVALVGLLSKDANVVKLNQPYSARDGVTHTLKEHGVKRGLGNVMIEYKNSLFNSPKTEHALVESLTAALKSVTPQLDSKLHCQDYA